MSQHDVDPIDVGWVSGSVTQQIQEQSVKYGVDAEMLGYASQTRPRKLLSEWVKANLGDVCTKLTDGSHNPPKSITSGLPMLSARNIQSGKVDFSNDYRLISPERFEEEDKRTSIAVNDLLLTIVGTLGRVALVADGLPKFTLQRSVAVLTAPKLHPEYFRYALEELEFQKQISDNAKGTAQKGIYLKKLSTLEIKLPPLSEQQQIAAKLDELLAQVDTLKTRLDTIPKILKRFRQSVLAAAVSGKLTEEWHKENGAAKWRKLTFESLIVNSANGLSKRSGDQGCNITVLRLADFKNAQRTIGSERTIALTEKEFEKYRLRKGDLLTIRVNGSVDLAGLFILYNGDKDEAYCDHFIRFSIDPDQACPKFIVFITNEGEGRKYLKDSLSTSAGQNTINQKSINALPIILPSLDEQIEIVRQVEQLFTYADQIEQRVKDAQARVNHLTQAILAKAFRGELTADWREQNPDLISGENSAEALLAKIQAERECASTKKPRTTSA